MCAAQIDLNLVSAAAMDVTGTEKPAAAAAAVHVSAFVVTGMERFPPCDACPAVQWVELKLYHDHYPWLLAGTQNLGAQNEGTPWYLHKHNYKS